MSENINKIDVWKKEILQAESDFAKMAADKGVPAAFKHFSAKDAALLRGETLIKGQNEIAKHYESNKALWANSTLSWMPDFIDVSRSGDLAYTYGHYTFATKDSSGAEQVSTGIFHTVWKRQEDGLWKFVWD